jgi:hypothetical protein
MTGMGGDCLPWMYRVGTTLAPAYTARRGQCRVLRGLHLCSKLTRLLYDPGVVVLVPVLKRRASVEFRHGTSYYRAVTA